TATHSHNAAVEFVWVVNTKEKVVANHLKLEIIRLGKKELHEAKSVGETKVELQGVAGVQACW
ncbi:hypothetical protein HID58_002974, partial [Brassica napus]